MLLTYGGFQSHFADGGEDIELWELRTRKSRLSPGSCRSAGSLGFRKGAHRDLLPERVALGLGELSGWDSKRPGLVGRTLNGSQLLI